MPTTPPSDGSPETPGSPYGPKSTTPTGSESVPPVVPPEAVPPVEATPPAPPAAAAPSEAPPAAPAPYGSVPPAPYQAAQPAPYGVPSPPQYYPRVAKPPTTLSLLSMIFGIIGLVLSCCYGAGIPFGIAGVILGHLGRKRENAQGMALAGLITGYASIGLSLVMWVLLFGLALVPWLAMPYMGS